MNELSPNQKLAGILLGEPVNSWIVKRREEGKSWRLVARALYERTGGQIDVTYETVRLWAEDAERVA